MRIYSRKTYQENKIVYKETRWKTALIVQEREGCWQWSKGRTLIYNVENVQVYTSFDVELNEGNLHRRLPPV